MPVLNRDLFFLGFEDQEDTKWIMEGGRRSFKECIMLLDWWNLEARFVKRKDTIKEAWIFVLGLPLHLWTNKILRRFCDACGGFIKLDMKTTLRRELLWACILVSLEGKEMSRVINVEGSSRSYEL